MKKGLVLGKFMPLHKGHLALFDFASRQCDELVILLCHTKNEIIKGDIREAWLKDTITGLANATVISFLYSEDQLPNTSVSSKDISLQWSWAVATIVPGIDVIFSSELYGDYLASFLHIKHIVFDTERTAVPISASAILATPLLNWQYISEVAKPFFVKKIVLLGTESTGKSSLTIKLAEYFKTVCVPEMARDILEKTVDCKPHHLMEIAALHAKEILLQTKKANGLLFIDTDINITKSYSSYLFKETMHVAGWIEEANKADLYIFLEPDCPFVQDGTRLSNEERDQLSLFHKEQLKRSGITYFSIFGNWNERFNTACSLTRNHFKI